MFTFVKSKNKIEIIIKLNLNYFKIKYMRYCKFIQFPVSPSLQ